MTTSLVEPKPDTLAHLARLNREGLLADLEHQFAIAIAEFAASDSPSLLLAAALVAGQSGEGHICLPLGQFAGRRYYATADSPGFLLPKLRDWRSELLQSRVVGKPGAFTPLILDAHGRLYLYRYWNYERRLAREVVLRSRQTAADPEPIAFRQALQALFPSADAEVQWQKVAAAVALLKPFCVISGGPGTGKTSTVVRILALLQIQAAKPLRIALAAPTGKAAARMGEAILAAKSKLPMPREVIDTIPEQAATLHRLLGVRPGRVDFRHHRGNPLMVDLLVVDEVSMVDLALMVKTIEALPPKARLILLGDRDQLASVEAGAVLGELCGGPLGFSADFTAQLQALTGEPLPPSDNRHLLADSVLLLQRSYRFGADSGIGKLAALVNRGEGEAALALLQQPNLSDIHWFELQGGSEAAFEQRLMEGFLPLLRASTVAEAFAAFGRFRLLCAHRQGVLGVEQLNLRVERLLRRHGLISARRDWYPGRPVMISRNDYGLKLFNGDIGITLPDTNAEGQLRVFFLAADGEFRSLPPSRLPPHETVYAMTVHKSQGSEFEQVVMALPNRYSPLLSRELIYTAITRAKASVELWGSSGVFKQAVAQRLQRASGLADQLLQAATQRESL